MHFRLISAKILLKKLKQNFECEGPLGPSPGYALERKSIRKQALSVICNSTSPASPSKLWSILCVLIWRNQSLIISKSFYLI